MQKITLLLIHVLISSLVYSQNDTLTNFSVSDPMIAYRTYDAFGNITGYLTGQGNLNYEFFAERYDISDSAEIVEVLSYHEGSIQNTVREAAIEIYSVGANKMPDQLLTSHTQTYRNLIYYGNPVSTPFIHPVEVGNSFFVAMNFLDYAHHSLTDTIAVLSSLDGSRNNSDLTNIGRNVIRVHHYSYEDLYTKTGKKIHLALFPVIQFSVVSGNKTFISNGKIKVKAPYPNPCKDNLTISYTLETSAMVSIQIMDQKGTLINEPISKVKSAGEHSELLDVKDLPKGNYHIIVEANGSYLGLKIIK